MKIVTIDFITVNWILKLQLIGKLDKPQQPLTRQPTKQATILSTLKQIYPRIGLIMIDTNYETKYVYGKLAVIGIAQITMAGLLGPGDDEEEWGNSTKQQLLYKAQSTATAYLLGDLWRLAPFQIELCYPMSQHRDADLLSNLRLLRNRELRERA